MLYKMTAQQISHHSESRNSRRMTDTNKAERGHVLLDEQSGRLLVDEIT